MKSTEYILCAVVKTVVNDETIIISGYRHGDCFNIVQKLCPIKYIIIRIIKIIRIYMNVKINLMILQNMLVGVIQAVLKELPFVVEIALRKIHATLMINAKIPM